MRRISWFQEMYTWNQQKITQQISSQTTIYPPKNITILNQAYPGMMVNTSLFRVALVFQCVFFFFEKPWGCSATRGEYDQPTDLPQWGGVSMIFLTATCCCGGKRIGKFPRRNEPPKNLEKSCWGTWWTNRKCKPSQNEKGKGFCGAGPCAQSYLVT